MAERDQQLDMTTRLCEALTHRLQDLERHLAQADADQVEREEARAEAEARAQATAEEARAAAAAAAVAAPAVPVAASSWRQLVRMTTTPLLFPLHLMRAATLPAHLQSQNSIHCIAFPRGLHAALAANSTLSFARRWLAWLARFCVCPRSDCCKCATRRPGLQLLAMRAARTMSRRVGQPLVA